MRVKYKLMIKGLLTYIPGLRNRVLKKKAEGACSARYCYSVWLRHLEMAYRNGLSTQPRVIVELGPGNSLGIGIAALITGSETYYALDVVRPSDITDNIRIFKELVELFQARERIPDEREFPLVKPYLDSYDFPRDILDEKRLEAVLRPERLKRIEDAIARCGGVASSRRENSISMKYIVPWTSLSAIDEESVDMVFSQAVLEHVDDLTNTYRTIYRWLKPGGVMSHQIDFKSHGTAEKWNGHWGYSEPVWKLIKVNRAYLLNRQPLSTHLRIIEDVGFKIVCNLQRKDPSGIEREHLAARWRDLSDDDLTCSGAFIQAVK